MPYVYFSPPWCVGTFGFHAEQGSIESINISSPRSEPVLWSFININFQNKLAVSRLQGSLRYEDAYFFYKGALLPQHSLRALGFADSSYDVVQQGGGEGMIARSFHFGVQCNKVAIAYQWMSARWFDMAVGTSIDIPAAP